MANVPNHLLNLDMANVPENLRQLMKKIASDQKYENPEILIDAFSSDGANYTSKLFTVIIREEKKEDLHLFAKVAATGESFRNNMPVDLYQTELFSYQRLTKIYASLQEENRVPEEHRLYFTKVYGSNTTTKKEILVLENLMAHGYRVHNRFQSIDWEYATAATAALAKLHALSFAFRKQRPEECEKYMDSLQNPWEETISTSTMFVEPRISALQNVKPEYRDALATYFMNVTDPNTSMTRTTRTTIITHGDFRGNNLLHRVREDGKMEIKIVDLQTLQGSSPVTDLIYFIFTGTDEEFRANYYEKLLDHYYTELSASLKRLNLDPEKVFSRQDFEYDMKQKLPLGLTLAVFALPVVTVDTENAPQVNENMELSNFSVVNTSKLYTERLNGVVNDYVKWGILKI